MTKQSLETLELLFRSPYVSGLDELLNEQLERLRLELETAQTGERISNIQGQIFFIRYLINKKKELLKD